MAEGIADGAALYHLVGKAEAVDHEEGKDDAHPAAVHAILHVVGGAAVVGVGTAALVELGECAFHECGRGAEDSHDPHPEDGTWAADVYGTGYAGQIAGADAAGEGDGEGLEAADLGGRESRWCGGM